MQYSSLYHAAVDSQFSENYLSTIRFLDVVISKLWISYTTESLLGSSSPPGASSEVSSSPPGPGGGAVQGERGGGGGGQGGGHGPHGQRVGGLLVAVPGSGHHHGLGQGSSFGWNERKL